MANQWGIGCDAKSDATVDLVHKVDGDNTRYDTDPDKYHSCKLSRQHRAESIAWRGRHYIRSTDTQVECHDEKEHTSEYRLGSVYRTNAKDTCFEQHSHEWGFSQEWTDNSEQTFD